ncbi:LIM domain-containing protein [Flavivirga eckloniae]|uniref:hypothetical protein n=1 Tax=Flavivirga eckloniae TaxID=1803846 RepID=UPI0026AF3B60|nr:hypothetical protein [Flavivirga eckloniae]
MKNIHCKVFGHDFQVTRDVTYHVKEYTCKHCKKQLTTNENGYLTELTPKFKEINDLLEHIHMKRHMRSTVQQSSDVNDDGLEYIHIKHKVKSIDELPSTINVENLLVFKH